MRPLLCLFSLPLAFAIAAVASAQCVHCGGSGCRVQEVISYRCVLVPETRPVKKVVYECRWVPFCQHKVPKPFHHDCCPDCECPRFKKVLVKREIEVGDVCTTKCVVEEVVERVPLPCCHCGAQGAEATAPLPAAMELPLGK